MFAYSDTLIITRVNMIMERILRLMKSHCIACVQCKKRKRKKKHQYMEEAMENSARALKPIESVFGRSSSLFGARAAVPVVTIDLFSRPV